MAVGKLAQARHALSIASAAIETGWATWSGTSMATAWVSGAAANVIAQNPGWSAGKVIGRLTDTASNLAGNTGRMSHQTRLDAAAAVCE
jgi:subtilisin family serine protease